MFLELSRTREIHIKPSITSFRSRLQIFPINRRYFLLIVWICTKSGIDLFLKYTSDLDRQSQFERCFLELLYSTKKPRVVNRPKKHSFFRRRGVTSTPPPHGVIWQSLSAARSVGAAWRPGPIR